MAANAVQVVLNSRNFVTYVEPNKGGSEREFFEGRDQEFVRHKATLVGQVSHIAAQLQTSAVPDAGVAKIKMRSGALAKTHTPTNKLFRPDLCPTIGGGNLGEIYVEVTPRALGLVAQRIGEAEDVVAYKLDARTKKERATPSTLRSEVGAVERVSLLQGDDKRSFSTAAALQHFAEFGIPPAYLIDVFYLPHEPGGLRRLSLVRQQLVQSFVSGLQKTFGGSGVAYRSDALSKNGCPVIVAILTQGPPAQISLESILTPEPATTPRSAFDIDGNRHQRLLAFLDGHPLVRRVNLPPVIRQSRVHVSTSTMPVALPKPNTSTAYPKVAVIDGGLDPVMQDWIVGQTELIDSTERDTQHGTFIAGLLIGARAIGNPASVAKEIDGCQIYDIALLPDQNRSALFSNYYPQGIDGFLVELRAEVEEAKTHGFRIFNLSVNSTHEVQPNDYSPFAAGLDNLARELDVIFVISAGNLESNHRPTWPQKPSQALALLAARTSSDQLQQPAECVSALAVAAVNPPDVPPDIEGAPTSYSRRGPGLRVGVKPDLAHYGGCGNGSAPTGHGILSVSSAGEVVSDQGTSFAAPLVAKTLATLDLQIQGDVPRETLTALMIHNARVPDVLSPTPLAQIARQFVGFGVPPSGSEMLETGDNAMTLVFSDRLRARQQLQFPFSWPACLYDPAKSRCSGAVRLTLVYSPPMDRGMGAEFLRVNMDAHLRQALPDGQRWRGQLVCSYLPPPHGGHEEKDLIEHGLKWWPVKVYKNKWSRYIGGSSQWMLAVDSLTRPNYPFPDEGIPFSVVLTISDDPHGTKPVFNDLKQWLTAHNVQCQDIRTASRLRPRP